MKVIANGLQRIEKIRYYKVCANEQGVASCFFYNKNKQRLFTIIRTIEGRFLVTPNQDEAINNLLIVMAKIRFGNKFVANTDSSDPYLSRLLTIHLTKYPQDTDSTIWP